MNDHARVARISEIWCYTCLIQANPDGINACAFGSYAISSFIDHTFLDKHGGQKIISEFSKHICFTSHFLTEGAADKWEISG